MSDISWASIGGRFRNENGRWVSIAVGPTEGDSNNVRFVIRGPHSEIDSILTRKEAQELHEVLGIYLSRTTKQAEQQEGRE